MIPGGGQGSRPAARALLALFAATVVIWWPVDCYWKSDDFLAVQYARDLGNVLHDFAGPQYGATGIWMFLRPVITASFWIDGMLGGTPFVSHLGNALAHGASAALAALVLARFLSPRKALAGALLWAVLPSHAGSVSWAVGRVDSYTTVFCLASLWALCRWIEGKRGSILLSLLFFAVALLAKESAFSVPILAGAIGAALAGAPGWRRRSRAALRSLAPFLALFAAYVAYRISVLGGLGGYAAASLDPPAMASGLGTVVLDLVDPLRWRGAGWLGAEGTPLGDALPWVGLVAALAALARGAWKAGIGGTLFCIAGFLAAAAPAAAFWADSGNVHNLRYYYFPSVAICGLIACGGVPAVIVMLLIAAAPFAAVRADYVDADRQDAAMHRMLLREIGEGAPGPWFVKGLPHANRGGTVVRLHYFVDRMLEPPFAPEAVPLYALRPAAELPGAWRLGADEDPPFALPEGTTMFFAGPDMLGRARPEALPELPLDTPGTIDLTTGSLDRMLRRQSMTRIRIPGLRPAWFRLTIFTATGYLCSVIRDHSGPADEDGRIDLLAFLGGDRARGIDPGRFAREGPHFVLTGLSVPATIDRDPSFPVLIEAGSIENGSFVPSHRARRLLRFRFDRGLAAWLRKALGT
ncbi:MAG: hypothetical protein Fur0037_19820 [Planctomycetota bacterium]